MSAFEHLRAIFVLHVTAPQFGENIAGEWMFEDDLLELLTSEFQQLTFELGEEAPKECPERDEIVAFVKQSGMFDRKGNDYTGAWYRFSIQGRNQLVSSFNNKDEAATLLSTLNLKAQARALAKVASELKWGQAAVDGENNDEQPSEGEDENFAPASDRLVHFSHNEQQLIDGPLESLIEAVNSENSINGEDGLRELVIGQLRAGRELIRAGIASFRSLELTLVVGLRLLLDKYGDHAIGAAAGKLLDLIVEAIKGS